MIGHTISHYRVVERLGEGGMGVVFKAEDTKLHRFVALKVLPPGAPVSEEERARLEREAQAAASLNDPHIATIYEFDESDGRAFIVMEYVEGETLRRRIRERLLPTKEAVDLVLDVAEGLSRAHAHGIIHRDIKPENVMISGSGNVKIMDFGLAEVAGRGRLTREGVTVGTLAYMSPEQVRAEPLDARTDIFSLGVVFYEILTGELPFKTGNEAALLHAILHEQSPLPSALDRRIPRQVDVVVSKMLEKDRSLRYTSAEELVRVLSDLRQDLETSVRERREKAIAVLPFENISPDRESDYFSDGLTEELIAHLARLRGTRVVSRTTSMQYKGTKKDMRTIGRELGVRYVIEGSVRKFQDDLRITAQLIEVDSDTQLWAETYRGKLADVFDIQERVSRQIVDALMLALTPAESVVLTKRSTSNPEAFEYVLRARDFLNRRTKHSFEFAMQLFQQAIDLDPQYAAAHAGLAETYAWYNRVYERKDLWLDKAIEASMKALMYDPMLSEAYAALALAYYLKGSLAEAMTASQKAIDLDPHSFNAYWILGRIYRTADRDREALPLFQKTLALNPDFYTVYADLRMTYKRLGNEQKMMETVEATLEMLPRYVTRHPDDARARMFLASMLAAAGRLEQARAEGARALELSPGDAQMMYNAACFYAQLGEKDRAAETLRGAVAAGYQHYAWIKRDPDLDDIRNEPAYIDLMKGR